jgi:tight adherence protein B
MPPTDAWVLAIAAAMSAALAVVVAFQAMNALRDWLRRRDALRTLRREDLQPRPAQGQASLVRPGTSGEAGYLERLADRVPQLSDLQHLLAQSGIRWSLEGFATRVVSVASILGLALFVFTGNGALAGAAFLLGGFAPFAYVRWRRKKRILLLESQLPDTIDLIARAVRAGHPLSEGLRMAAEEAQEPLASEFRITFEEQKFGLPFEEALLGLGDRVEIVDVRILITAILVQREVGGNLSEILEQIAETMRARFSLKRQVRVYTAQGRMSGYTLAALPVLVGLVVLLINPDYIRTLFEDPLGQALLVVAAVMQGIGFLWIRRIVDVRY